MAPRTTPDLAEADAGTGPQSPGLTTADLYRLMVERVRMVSPAATDICVTWTIAGQTKPGCIPLTVLPPRLSETAADIMRVLSKVEVGQFVNGAALAMMIDDENPPDHTAGGWRRAVEELKDNKLIDSHPRKGYCRL